MQLNLKDRVVLITGATGGIGQALVRAFAQEGCRLAISSTSQAKLDAFAPTLGLGPDRLKTFVADVTDEGQVRDFVDGAAAYFGQLDVLVITAGYEGKAERLDEFYKKGVRLMSLTWNYENSVAYPNSDDPEIMKKGLKPFGIETVERMNEMGMIVDISHLSDGGIYDVFKYTKKPIVASHSNARGCCNHRRNLTDDMLRLLGENGGLTGLNYCAPFMSAEAEKNNLTTCEDIVRQALYIKNKAGIDALAFGSDFDGIGNELDFGDYSGMPKVIEALEKHFTPDEIDKICWKNAYRVIGESMK